MGQDASEIRHEVEQARTELGQTVEALMYRVNAPNRLKHRLADRVRTARTGLDRRMRKLRDGVHDVRRSVARSRSRGTEPGGGA